MCLECMIYKRKCLEEGSTPVKESFYRFIFNSSSTSVFTFLKNIGVISVNLIRQLSTRIFLAKMLRANRRNTLQTKLQCARSDRQTGMLKTHQQCVLTFESHNLSTCRDQFIFLQTKKLNLYNLTAHSSLSETGYCAIWKEGMSGRGANDIASAFFKTLDRIILDHPDATSIITWSDSCVPKQKLHNSICYGRILDEDSPDYNEVLII